jgi:purine-binding chemotaxis protein CheW
MREPVTFQRVAPRDPLEVILAGREAACCDENLQVVSESLADKQPDVFKEFLCFKVSDEVYGIDIMDIKELIKPREVTEVPRAPSFVSGVISLRGVIIPIIDMLDRLGLARVKVTGRERVIVVRQGDSFCGLLVDEIIQVVRVARNDIEAAPTVLEGIDRDFVTGIGRSDGRMIILLNLANIINIHLV